MILDVLKLSSKNIFVLRHAKNVPVKGPQLQFLHQNIPLCHRTQLFLSSMKEILCTFMKIPIYHISISNFFLNKSLAFILFSHPNKPILLYGNTFQYLR